MMCLSVMDERVHIILWAMKEFFYLTIKESTIIYVRVLSVVRNLGTYIKFKTCLHIIMVM